MYRVLVHGYLRDFEVPSVADLPEDVRGLPCYSTVEDSPLENLGNWLAGVVSRNGVELIDFRYERRKVNGIINDREAALKIVSQYHDWLDYDHSLIVLEVERLRHIKQNLDEQISKQTKIIGDQRRLMSQVYDANQAGGHGSRKKVRELLAPKVTICDGCDLADCQCED